MKVARRMVTGRWLLVSHGRQVLVHGIGDTATLVNGPNHETLSASTIAAGKDKGMRRGLHLVIDADPTAPLFRRHVQSAHVSQVMRQGMRARARGPNAVRKGNRHCRPCS